MKRWLAGLIVLLSPSAFAQQAPEIPYDSVANPIGHAVALTLLAAHLKGWAPLSILDAYEAERWPITSQVSRFAMSHAEAEIRRREANMEFR